VVRDEIRSSLALPFRSYELVLTLHLSSRYLSLCWAVFAIDTACQKGLVNGNVLNIFRNNVSKDLFLATVGDGRLADKWVANATSVKVRYTDGSMKGAGKNARRKGKSTSNWVKKNKLKIGIMQERKRGKEAKRKTKLKRAASSV